MAGCSHCRFFWMGVMESVQLFQVTTVISLLVRVEPNLSPFFRNIDLPNPTNGEVPLHIAIKRGHINVIKVLLEMNCRLDIVTALGDSVFHYAATTNADIIKVMSCRRDFYGFARFFCICLIFVLTTSFVNFLISHR